MARRYSTGDARIRPIQFNINHIAQSEKSPSNSPRNSNLTSRNISSSNNNTPVTSRRRKPPSTLARANSFGGSASNTPKKVKKASVYSFSLGRGQDELEKEFIKKRSTAIQKNPGPNARELRTRFPKKRISSDIDKMSIVTNNIVLGSKRDAANKSLMDNMGITHVLNMAQQVPNHHPKDYIYHKINILDAPTTDITESYAAASSFISRVEKVKGRVLVHCVSGVSRSVSVVIMHFIGKYRMSLKNAYNHIHAVRPYIHPNNGFKFQMAMFELEHLGTTSIANNSAGEAWSFYEWNSVKALYRNQSVDGSEGIEQSFYTVCCNIS